MTLAADQHRWVEIRCSDCGNPFSIMLNCGDRLCPACNGRRFGVLLNRYKKFFSTISVDSLQFFTFTLRHDRETDLGDIHGRLIGYVHRLIAYGKRNWDWQGGVTGYEATNYLGHGWNDHAHLIIQGGRFVPQEELSKVWLSITGDSYIVDVRKCMTAESALGYLCGYVLKTDLVADEFRDEYNAVFHGRRLLQSWGTWYNRTHPDDDGDGEFLCPCCGGSTWITEFELRRLYKTAERLEGTVPLGSSP